VEARTPRGVDPAAYAVPVSREDVVDGNAVNLETVRLLTRLQGLAVPNEDLPGLAAGLADQLAAGLRILERYGSSAAEPPLVFDPRWE
jgi:hypothetical protein